MEQFIHYISNAISGTKPIVGVFLTAICYICFPEKAYETAAFAVGVAIILDIVTKYIAISRETGGYRNALRQKKILSKTLWDGTRIKLVSYLIVFILAGLSYRVTMLKQVSVFLATVIYTVIFLRETQSILENLCDAGADLGWLIIWTKKKEQQILESNILEEVKGSDDIEKI